MCAVSNGKLQTEREKESQKKKDSAQHHREKDKRQINKIKKNKTCARICFCAYTNELASRVLCVHRSSERGVPPIERKEKKRENKAGRKHIHTNARTRAHTHVTFQRSAKRERETIVSTSKEKTTTTEQTTFQRVKRRITGLPLFILIGRSLASFKN